MFSRIAVINRGEPAVRLIRAVRELNSEFGYGIKVIALHTAAERGALFVRLADEGVLLRDKGDLGSPYLDHAELERAMIAGKVDACWPGWGFVSEDAGFVELCDRIGVTFIGPPAAAMRKLGDKVQAKYLAEATGVPVAPWSGGPVEDMASALEHAKQIGYPMILKARSGGGGRGIRMVFDPSELEEAIERTQSEALKAFNDQVIFMEKLVVGGRHIEVQIIADNYGNAWAPGIRDCSIQRRNQKLIEESGSPALTAAAGRRAAQGRGRAGQGGRVPRRRHGGVPVPAGGEDVRLPGGEHPAAGRASDHRGVHRARPGEAADPGAPTGTGWRVTRRRTSATPSRPG